MIQIDYITAVANPYKSLEAEGGCFELFLFLGWYLALILK